MRSWRTHRKQSGDTIVEVLIAAAIVSTVLIGAFAVATRSTTAVRDSQEHSEMAQLLQGQVEGVRKLALAETGATTGIFSPNPKYFCINQSGARAPETALTSLPTVSDDDYANYDAACKDLQGRYNVTISYDSTPSSHVFTFVGRWDRLGGGKNEERMSYRIYPGATAAAAAAAAAPSPFKPRTAANSGKALVAALPSAGAPCYVEGSPNNYPDCYTFRIVNASDNPSGTIDHCTIYWGDKTPIETYSGTSTTCANGTVLGPHTFPEEGTITNKVQYKVVLTNYFKDGGTATYPFAGIYAPR